MNDQSPQPKNYRGTIVFFVVAALALALIAYGKSALAPQLVLGSASEPTVSVNSGPLSLITRAYSILSDAYVNKIDPMVLVEGALKGMAEATKDPYTTYFTPQQLQKFTEQTSGTYGGIGATIEMKDGYMTVVSTMEGSPSTKVGMRTGDQIQKVDGKEIKGVTLEEGVAQVKGPAGSTVVLTIKRPGIDAPYDLSLTRANIVSPTINSKMLDGKIGYVVMSQFAETTTAQFDKALADLKSQGMKGLILDLRNNGGGRLDTCVDIANRLVPKGPIVQRVDRDGTKEYEYSTLEKRDFPVVVLVNNYSASASEILAGALQDTKSATIVGVHSFGKASVQQTFPLSNGGALKVTVQKYLTPNGRDILGAGIQPDIKVIDTAWPLMPANPADTKTLTQDDVDLLQAKLRLLGYSINSSETTIGADTSAALKSFQGKKSLSVTGKLNQETTDALNLASYESTKDDKQLAAAVEAMKQQIQ